MDDLVKAALKKWPNVPACFGWLGLDARGQWWMRDDRAQACGTFASGHPGAKGSLLRHDKLIEFIARNYEPETVGPLCGAWFFQNGPQKVYIELESTPFIYRVSDHIQNYCVHTHTGHPVTVSDCFVDEQGHAYLHGLQGVGRVHSQDMTHLAQAIEEGLYHPVEVVQRDLAQRFGFLVSPQAARSGT